MTIKYKIRPRFNKVTSGQKEQRTHRSKKKKKKKRKKRAFRYSKGGGGWRQCIYGDKSIRLTCQTLRVHLLPYSLSAFFN